MIVFIINVLCEWKIQGKYAREVYNVHTERDVTCPPFNKYGMFNFLLICMCALVCLFPFS